MQNHLYLYPNIAKVRKGKLTQAELAEQLGISQQEISRYETGEVKAPINYIIDPAAVCKVSVDQILGFNVPTAALSASEQRLLSIYSSLTFVNKIKAEERMQALLDSQS
ncbi:MAG: helix-turn-helix transcriptional regulator [Ruminococcus sp.]|nr:helix-turn-helix transcriptional regulator [Ruminococcus sp.]